MAPSFLDILDGVMLSRVGAHMGPGAFSRPLRAICTRARDAIADPDECDSEVMIIFAIELRSLRACDWARCASDVSRNEGIECAFLREATRARWRDGMIMARDWITARVGALHARRGYWMELKDIASALGMILSDTIARARADAGWSDECAFICNAFISSGLGFHVVAQHIAREFVRAEWPDGCVALCGVIARDAGHARLLCRELTICARNYGASGFLDGPHPDEARADAVARDFYALVRAWMCDLGHSDGETVGLMVDWFAEAATRDWITDGGDSDLE